MNNHATVQSSTPVSAAPLLQVSGALIAIIALILAAAWLVKRLGFAPKRTGVNGLKISASASLGARERVVVVDVEDARLVLGVTAGQINLLHKLPPSAPTEEIPQTDFQSVMKNLLKQEALKKFVTPGNLMCSSPYPQFFSLTRKYSRYE